MGLRTRRSIQDLMDEHASGKTTALENLIRAFRNIQALPPDNADSFESIAGYHGEPFTGKSPSPLGEYWGGFCQHNTILFPTWHRALILRLERALQNNGPDPNLALPFWDECAGVNDSDPDHPQAPTTPIPTIFTSPTLDFTVDGSNSNPLYSYTLQKSLTDDESGQDDPADPNRYTKPAGYETVRYPLSGLVGNSGERLSTDTHNKDMRSKYPTADKLAAVLNANVKAWLEGTVQIDKSDGQTTVPDTYSIYSRYLRCLAAPFYPLFSNKATKNAWLKALPLDVPPETFVSLDEPHNAIHLALGGFYQPSRDNADEIRGANGDIGENNTAAFDPIFFFHHCFVDYVFWQWQRRHGQTSAITHVEPLKQDDDGFKSNGMPLLPPGTPLDFTTALAPIQKPSNENEYYSSNDVIDIAQLGYTYGNGSLTDKKHKFLEAYGRAEPVSKILYVHNIDRSTVPGSFIIRTYVDNKHGHSVEIGRSEILSRYHLESCANCQNHLEAHDVIVLHKSILPLLKGGGQDLEQLNVKVILQTHTQIREPDYFEHNWKSWDRPTS